MAITSPFKLGHSSSRDEQQGGFGTHTRKGSKSNTSTPGVSRSTSENMHKKNPSVASQGSAGVNLAQLYEMDKQKLIKCCFSKLDETGTLIESYITHVRIVEDSLYPNMKPPEGASSQANKKERILALAVKKDGTVYLHKGRDNKAGVFQIGRTWNLAEMKVVQKETTSDVGFIVQLGKHYYWETNSLKERQVFVSSLIRVYRRFTNGLVPELLNWDLSMFGLDQESYKKFLNPNRGDISKTLAIAKQAQPPTARAPPQQDMHLKPIQENTLRKESPANFNSSKPVISNPVLQSTTYKPSQPGATAGAFPNNLPFPKPMQPIQRAKNGESPPSSSSPTYLKSTPLGYPPKQNNSYNSPPAVNPVSSRPSEILTTFNKSVSPSVSSNQSPSTPRKSMVDSVIEDDYNDQGSTNSLSISKQRQQKPSSFSEPKFQKSTTPITPENPLPTESPIQVNQQQFRSLSPLKANKASKGLSSGVAAAGMTAGVLRSAVTTSGGSSRTLDPSSPTRYTSELSSPAKLNANELSTNFNNLSIKEDLPLENVLGLEEDTTEPLKYNPSRTKSNDMDLDLNLTRTRSSAHDVKFVAHRKSFTEFVKEQENQDDDDEMEEEADIADLYNYSEGSEDLDAAPQNFVAAPSNSSFEHPIEDDLNITPVHSVIQDESYSFDQAETSLEKVTVTPVAPSANVLSDNEDLDKTIEDEDEPAEDEYDDLDISKKFKSRSHRANTVTSAMDTMNEMNNQASFDDIFDEIDWQTSDDSDTLVSKLLKELANTEYDTTKQLIEIQDKSDTFKQLRLNIVEECDRLTPLLNFFSVELAGFVKDIRHVENESQGLQVETTNKKNLWNDLQNLLNTISLDDSSLRILLSSDLDRDLVKIEKILSDLENAIVAIRGSDKSEEDLGDMKVLKERRAAYESVVAKFLNKLTKELDYRFKTLTQNLDLDLVRGENNLKGQLSQLMVYSGFTLFAKIANDDSFYQIITLWESSANLFTKKVIDSLTGTITQQSKKQTKFSLSSADILTRTKVKLNVNESKHERLKQKLGFSDSSSSPSRNNDYSATLLDTKVSLVPTIFSTLDSITSNVILEQEFLAKFFHMSSDTIDLSTFIEKYPPQIRSSLLSSESDDMDFDRENAKEIFSSTTAIFQPSLDEAMKVIVLVLRDNQINAPAVILYVELFERVYSTSSQNFLLFSFKKLIDRLKVDWLKFIDNQVKIVHKSPIAQKKVRELSVVIRNFTDFVQQVEKNLYNIISDESLEITSKLEEPVDINELEVRSIVNNSYAEISKVILENLAKDDDEKTGLRLKLYEETEHKEKLNHTINLIQNSNWIKESLGPLKLAVLDSSLAKAKEIYETNKDHYINGFVTKHVGKLVDFVTGVEGLVSDGNSRVDPSKRNAYTKNVLVKLLSVYEVSHITKTVAEIRGVIVKHFMMGSDISTEKIQAQLVDRLWSALQTEFVGYSIRLETIVEKYYKDVPLHFVKKDIIAAFNAARG